LSNSTPSPERILDEVRARRPRTPRWIWILALVVGVPCLVAFGYAMLGGAAGTPNRTQLTEGRGMGFGVGVIVGLAAGIGIGLAIARQRRDHSSRNRP
jgi:hypothetical protein